MPNAIFSARVHAWSKPLKSIPSAKKCSPDEYDHRYQQLEQRYQQQEQEHQKVSDQIACLTTRRAKAAAVRDYLATQPPLEYSDEAWNILMQYSCVTKEGLIQVVLAN
ncbi:hypothetical protein [Actinomyces sp. S4-C9]|uniref:hypothetical protein n=1 Tax=Actinomyces sp. S4-C9 TaxID=1219581 RepID=UPI00050F775D|nr:hypothetical protein [Actinomyces sp. S4-C9]KGF01229.1 hypothetical protein HMPREF1628_06710 [Actinomyces sp. S4-C9]